MFPYLVSNPFSFSAFLKVASKARLSSIALLFSIPRFSPIHFFQAFAIRACLEAYLIRTSSLSFILASITFSAASRMAILLGLYALVICSMATAGKYSSVVPGNPKTMVKSPSSMPSKEIGKKCLGL